MKEYSVYFDMEVTCHVIVEAESEEQALELAEEKVNKQPYYYANKIDSVFGFKMIEAIASE